MDAWRSGDSDHVAPDLPRIDPSSVDLTVEQSSLTVQAKRTSAFPEDDQVLVAERPHCSFTRQVVLGKGQGREHVETSYEDGVLHLTTPGKPSRSPAASRATSGGAQHQVIDMTSGDGSDQKARSPARPAGDLSIT